MSAAVGLKVNDLHVRYGVIRALQGVTLEVRDGQIVSVVGSNGAGKSTLLRAIVGLVRPERGTVECPVGADITRVKPHRRIRQLGISLVPEGRAILKQLTVRENLALGAKVGELRRGRGTSETRMREILDLFPVLGDRRAQMAGDLSGGEQQMLTIGRALLTEPDILLLDEPSIGLAPLVVKSIFAGLEHYMGGRNVSVLLVEQNTELALRVASYAYVIERGSVSLQGPPAEVLADAALHEAYLGKVGEQSEPDHADAG